MSAPQSRGAAPLPSPGLTEADLARLSALFERGAPENTRRAYERRLVYIAAWKRAAFGAPLAWPETEAAALRFVLDHAEDLGEAPADHPARRATETLIAVGLRRSLVRHAPATLDRRIATWRALHRVRNLPSPFEAPLLRKARRAGARPKRRHSAHPVTKDVLETVLAAMERDVRGLRDRALLLFVFASGGRRLSEIARLHRAMLSLERLETDGIVDIRLYGAKTTAAGESPALVLKGRAARLLAEWLRVGGIPDGHVFRAISRSGRVLPRGLSDAGVKHIFKARLAEAGFLADYASPLELSSGFMTEAAYQGVLFQAAMRLSLHCSAGKVPTLPAPCRKPRRRPPDAGPASASRHSRHPPGSGR